MRLRLFFLIALLILCFAVVSCSDGADTSETDAGADSVADSENESDASGDSGKNEILIVNGEGTEFTFVYPSGNKKLAEVCNDMKFSAYEHTKKNVFTKADTTKETQYEIVVGKTNREETAELSEGLSEDQYRIAWVGDKLVVAGGTNQAAYEGALMLKLSYFSNIEGGEIRIPSDINIEGRSSTILSFSNLKEGWSTCVYEDDKGEIISFAMFVPAGYSPDKEYPLLLNLHGDGYIGKDVNKILDFGEVIFGVRAAAEYKETIVIAPAATKTWYSVPIDPADHMYKNFSFEDAKPSTELDTIIELINDCTERLAVDKSRVYLSGYSKGCMSSWYLMSKYPDLFAAATIACGTGDPSAVGKITHIPIWVFAGSADNIVSYDEVKAMYDAYEAAGGNGKFTTYAGFDHNITYRISLERELISWLYSQEKK